MEFEMEEFEMKEESDLLYSRRMDLMKETESNSSFTFTSICRRCKEDESEGELIRPCLCTGDREYIHVRCLEIIANIRKHSLFCAVCDVPYPLKLKYKPLIEWCRNTEAFCAMFRKIYFSLFIIICILIYNLLMFTLIIILFINLLKCERIINALFYTFSIIFFLAVHILQKKCKEVLLKHLNKKIYPAYNRWLDNNKEYKVDKSEIVTWDFF